MPSLMLTGKSIKRVEHLRMEIVVRSCEIGAQMHKEGRAFADGDCGEWLRDWGANALPLRHGFFFQFKE
jgi:hypothetical protein